MAALDFVIEWFLNADRSDILADGKDFDVNLA